MFNKYRLWFIFFIYLAAVGISIYHHELWGDEVHAWNIARSSSGMQDLINNTRYEGHPLIWYLLLFILSHFTHTPESIQYLQFLIVSLTAFIFLFKTTLNFHYKLFVLFGYYFFYEYGIFSRNYAIGILFSFAISSVIVRDYKYKQLAYYILLFFLSNTHFLAFLLAASFHVYVLATFLRAKEKKGIVILHVFLGVFILLSALYFIFPPVSSGLNTEFWLKIWSRNQFVIIIQAPLRALCPLPAWWEYHSWNTNALLDAQRTISVLKFINPFISLGLIISVIYVLYPNRQSLLFFSVNLALTLIFAIFFPLTSARYTGFIYVALVLALSLSNNTLVLNNKQRFLLYFLFLLQAAGTCIAVKRDWEFPFSYGRELKIMSTLVPKEEELITDVATLNYVSAYLDKPVYCLEFGREKAFLLWDKEINPVKSPDFYTKSILFYFQKRQRNLVYFMTNASQSELEENDSMLFTRLAIKLLDHKDKAVERYSNLFLYKISIR